METQSVEEEKSRLSSRDAVRKAAVFLFQALKKAKE